MSKTLFWRPPPQEREARDIGSLTTAISDMFLGDFDSTPCYPEMLDKRHINYLYGVKWGRSKDSLIVHDACELIDAINKYDKVEIFLE